MKRRFLLGVFSADESFVEPDNVQNWLIDPAYSERTLCFPIQEKTKATLNVVTEYCAPNNGYTARKAVVLTYENPNQTSQV